MQRIETLRHDLSHDDETNSLLDEVQELIVGGRAESYSHVESCLYIGLIQRKKKEWECAKTTYQEIMRQYPNQSDTTPPQFREILTSMSECAYNLKDYEYSIGLGEGAIDMNRYFPWSHKYIVLSRLAIDERGKAQQAAAEAVVYETPWDDEHRAEVKFFYRQYFK